MLLLKLEHYSFEQFTYKFTYSQIIAYLYKRQTASANIGKYLTCHHGYAKYMNVGFIFMYKENLLQQQS